MRNFIERLIDQKLIERSVDYKVIERNRESYDEENPIEITFPNMEYDLSSCNIQ